MEPNDNIQAPQKTALPWKRRSTIAGLTIVAVTAAGIGAFAIAKDGPTVSALPAWKWPAWAWAAITAA